MENLARAFDLPVESQEHQTLATTAWMGGEFVSIRYWLGRLLQRNLFRESDDAVKGALRDHILDKDCVRGSLLVSDPQAWSSFATLLQFHVETEEGRSPPTNAKLAVVLQAIMANSELTDAELAVVAHTTEKQIARMSDISLLRRQWNPRSG